MRDFLLFLFFIILLSYTALLVSLRILLEAFYCISLNEVVVSMRYAMNL